MKKKLTILTFFIALCTLCFGQSMKWTAVEGMKDNMALLSVVKIGNELQASSDLELAAFKGEECRGTVRLQYVNIQNAIDGYFAYLTIQGEEGESFTFKLYDHSSETEYVLSNSTIEFNEATQYNEVNPFVVTFIDGFEAMVADKYYATLADAFSNVQDGETVTLLKDVEVGTSIYVNNKNITFDGGNYTITQAEGSTYGNYLVPLRFNSGNYTIKDVVFDGWTTKSVVRIENGSAEVDNLTIKNTNWNTATQAKSYGVLYIENSDVIVKNSNFLNNVSGSTITYGYGSDANMATTLTIDNCLFENNESNGDCSIVYYVKGSKCTITNSEFVGNKVNCNTNGATVYLGFQENCTITNNLFENNEVKDSSTSTRLAGAIFFGYEAKISGNAFLNNKAENANGSKGIAQDVCTSTYYECNIDLSGNYWGGNAPVAGEDYHVQHQTGEANFDLNDYYTSYATDENGNVVLEETSKVEFNYVAKAGKFSYESLEAAFKAATSDCTIEILKDVTIDYAWDCRNTGSKFTVPVTINGNGKTITFTNKVYDAGNHLSAFRFEADATVNNLTINMENAISGFQGRFRAISAKANLTVNECTFIGNGSTNNTRAIIFGEGAGANAQNLEISIINSTFEGWKRGIGDNENEQDVKNVTITGNTFEDANVSVSANTNVIFTGNKTDSDVQITSYTADNALNVTAKENELTDGRTYTVNAGGTLDLQDGFLTPVAEVGGKTYFSLQAAIDKTTAENNTVKVLQDVELTEGLTVAADKTVVLDLNGKTISRNTETATSTAAITNNGNLTIKDSSDPSTGKITAFAANPDTQAVPYYASNTITNYGVLTVLGGTIENSTGDEARAAFPIDNNSTSRDAIVTIVGGKVTGRGAIRQFANSTTHKNEVYVEGGEVFGSSYAIWVQNPGSGDPKAALNIEDGTLSKILISPSANFEVAISGGTLTEVAIWEADETHPERNPSAFITGGTFTTDVNAYCAEGFQAEYNDDGTYSIQFADYIVLPEGVTAANCEQKFGDNTVTDGTNYYATMIKALEGIHLTGKNILYCKPGADVGVMTHGHVCSSLTVYGNGAYVSGGEQEFELGQYNYCHNGAYTCSGITEDLTLTVNYLHGSGAWGTHSVEYTFNMVFNNCENMGRIYMNGTGGDNNITLNNCTFTSNTGGECKLYSNANGTINVNECEFSNVHLAINLNHKVAGEQIVNITNTTFDNVGTAEYDYAAPVRVLSSVEGATSNVTINGSTFRNTVANKLGQGADILLDYGVGLTTATVNNTAANVVVERENNAGIEETTTVVNQTYSFNNRPYVAQVGETKYIDLQEAINAATEENNVVTLLGNIEISKGVTVNQAGVAITIEGNDNKITPAEGATFTGLIFTIRTDLTLSKVTIEGFTTTSDIVNVYKGANLTLTDCALTNNNGRSIVCSQSGYENIVTITGTTFTENISSRGIVYCGDGTGKYLIDNCDLVDNVNSSTTLIGLPGTVSLTNNTIKNNKVTVQSETFVAGAAYCWGADVTITGNTIEDNIVETNSTKTAAVIVKTGDKNIDLSNNTIKAEKAIYVRDSGTGVVTIASGTIDGTITSANGAGIAISGGTFTTDVTEFCAEGFICVYNAEQGNYSVEDNPQTHYIATLEDLKAFRDDVNAGNNYQGITVYLSNDIDLSSTRSAGNWEPIGTDAKPFKGTFDGQNHTIKNLVIAHPGGEVVVNHVGFFGKTNGATIKNFTIENVNVTGSGRVAAVVGNFFTGSISGVTVKGNINIAGYQYVGAIIGWGYANVSDCHVIGDGVSTSVIKKVAKSEIYGSGTNGYVGGITGWIGEGNSVIDGCSVKDITITTNDDTVGGICGIFHYGNTFTNSTLDNVVITAPDNDTWNGIIAGDVRISKGSVNTYSVTVNNVTATAAGETLPELGHMSADAIAEQYIDGNKYYGIVGHKDDAVAEISGKKYLRLSAAFAAAQENDVIVLISDVTEEFAINNTANITLDMASLTLTGAILPSTANVTIKDGTIENSNAGCSAIEINAGSLNLNNVNINSARHAVRIDGEVVATINGGEYNVSVYENNKTRHAVNVSGNAQVTIVNGTFVGPYFDTTSDSGSALNVQTGATVTVEGGNFSGGKRNTLSAKGTLVVKGGTYTRQYDDDTTPDNFLAPGYVTEQVEENVYTVKAARFEIFYTAAGEETTSDNAAYSLMFTITDYDNNEVSVKIGSKTPSVNSGINLVTPTTAQFEDLTFKVTSVADNGFNGTSFKKVTISEGVETIGNKALYFMSKLTELVLPKTLVSVGEQCIGAYNPSSVPLKSIVCYAAEAPSAFEPLSNASFQTCVEQQTMLIVPNAADYTVYSNANGWKFTNILGIGSTKEIAGKDDKYTLLATVTSMNPMECSIKIGNTKPAANSNAELVIPETVTFFEGYKFNVTSIPDNAFSSCLYFVRDLVIPQNVRTIGASAFNTSHFVANETVRGTLTLNEGLVSIGSQAFKKDYFKGDLSIPSTVETIASNAFQYASFDGILTINGNINCANAFGGTEFTELVLVDGVEEIKDSNAFSGMLSLKEVVLPSTLQTIGMAAFKDDDAIEVIHTYATEAPAINSIPGNVNYKYAFSETVKANAVLYVHGTSYDDVLKYKNATNEWKEFKNIHLYGAVAQIEEVEYLTIQDAINAAQAGETITVIDNVELTETITVAAGKEVVLDLNGKTVSYTTTEYKGEAMITNNGNLTITDTSDEKTGSLSYAYEGGANSSYGFGNSTIENKGVLTINAGTVENTSEAMSHASYAINTGAGATLNVEGGNILNLNGHAVRMVSFDTELNTVNINGGYIEGTRALQVQLPGSASSTTKPAMDLNITGGELMSNEETYNLAIYVFSNGQSAENVSVEISGGTFNGNVAVNAAATNSMLANAVAITDGTFNGEWGVFSYADDEVAVPVISITGGTFATNYSEFYAADEQYVFELNENGTYSVVEQTIFTQTINLSEGWNWFSYYVNTDLTALETALGTNGIEIKSQNNGFVRYQSVVYNGETYYYWNGNLETISETQMYMINTNDSYPIEISGNIVDHNQDITLNKGWNWIGYPTDKNVDINEALKNLNPIVGDEIKTQDNGYAQYVYDEQHQVAYWNGSLNTLIAGEGYKYYSSADDIVSFKYNISSDRGELKANVTTDGNHWTPNAGQYPNNMTMTAMVEVEGGDYEVAAFVNGECRGSARPIYIEAMDAHILFLTIHGEDVEEMTFRYYDIATGEEFDLNDRMNYSNDAIVGTIAEPYIFSRGTTGIGEASLSEVNIYPNPTTTGTEINLQATCDTVEVFNALGVKVAEYHNVDSLDAFETAGIYVIRITNGGNVKHCSLVVK